MKLGLVLKITNGGEAETFYINKKESWARFASDARSAIKELQGFDGSDKSVYLLKFLGSEGYLLSVIKSRPEGSGRPNDNTAAWIFVPSTAVVSAVEMEQVLKQVEEAISESKGIDKTKLGDAFGKDYAVKNVLLPAVGKISSTAEGSYALRYFNGDSDFTLGELLGDNLAQIEYAKYKGVFLVDKNSGITLSSNNVLKFEPKQLVAVSPLKSVEGFVALIQTPRGVMKFDRDIELATGEKIVVEWRKDNYAPIVKTFTAGDGKIADLDIKGFEIKVRIQRSWFKVKDSNGISIRSARVSINHQLITGAYLDVREALLSDGIIVDVHADEYEDYHKELKEFQHDMVIKLPHRKYHMEYTVPVYDKDGERVCDAKLVLDANKKLCDSPLKGYEISGGELVYRTGYKSKLKTFAYGFVAGALVFLLYAGAQAMEEYEFQFGWPPFKHIVQQESQETNLSDETEGSPNDSIKNNYLDANKSWRKDSLDAYEETMGLFDELNEFKLEHLKKRVDEKKLSSENLQKVVDALKKNQDNGYDPHIGKESNKGKFNSEKEKVIDIDDYIKWLSVQHDASKDTPVTDTSTKKNSEASTTSKITGESTTKSEKKDPDTNDSKNIDNQKKNGKRGEE